MAPSLLSAGKANPTFFLLTLLVGASFAMVGLVGLVSAWRNGRHGRTLGVVAVGGAALALAISVAGYLVARSKVDHVMSVTWLSDSEKTELAVYGYAEALYNLWFGLGAAAPLLIVGVAAIVISRMRSAA